MTYSLLASRSPQGIDPRRILIRLMASEHAILTRYANAESRSLSAQARVFVLAGLAKYQTSLPLRPLLSACPDAADNSEPLRLLMGLMPAERVALERIARHEARSLSAQARLFLLSGLSDYHSTCKPEQSHVVNFVRQCAEVSP